MSVDVTVRVGNWKNDPVDVIHEVMFSDVNHQLLDGVEGRGESNPLATMDQ